MIIIISTSIFSVNSRHLLVGLLHVLALLEKEYLTAFCIKIVVLISYSNQLHFSLQTRLVLFYNKYLNFLSGGQWSGGLGRFIQVINVS